MKLRVEIVRGVGDLTPFEIHIIFPEEYEAWTNASKYNGNTDLLTYANQSFLPAY
ncbi:hypothetical protein D1872_340810 [compost metagenome]